MPGLPCAARVQFQGLAEKIRQGHLRRLPRRHSGEEGEGVHQPVGDGDCLACHDPHASDRKALLKKSAPALCWDCHDNFLEKAKFTHDVVEDCTGCHNPHSTGEQSLMKKNIPALCFDCHDQKDIAAVKGHAGAEGKSCLACHDPHTGTDKFLLRGSGKKTAATQ